MTTQDPHIHGRKTIAGTDLTFGATTTTPCGKKRPRARTSASPDRVTCPDCRAWAAGEERELARGAVTAAELAREYPDLSPYAPEDFTALAGVHDARALQWEGQP